MASGGGGGGIGSPHSPNGYGSSPLHSPNHGPHVTGGGAATGSYPGQVELKEFQKFTMVSGYILCVNYIFLFSVLQYP